MGETAGRGSGGRGLSAGPTRCGQGRAFTLLEILLAVALIGLLASVLVTGAIRAMGEQPSSPEEVFWHASREARQAALKSEHEVRLSFDDKAKALVVADGTDTHTFAIPASRDLSVLFLAAQSGRNAVLIGGQLMETQGLPDVTYYPDGTCTPFRVQFRATGPARVIAIDPWTCAAMLRASDENGY